MSDDPLKLDYRVPAEANSSAGRKWLHVVELTVGCVPFPMAVWLLSRRHPTPNWVMTGGIPLMLGLAYLLVCVHRPYLGSGVGIGVLLGLMMYIVCFYLGFAKMMMAF